MQLKHYLDILWRQKWVVLATFLVTYVVALLGLLVVTPLFTSTGTMRIATAVSGGVDWVDYDVDYSERLSNTWVELAQSGPLLDEVAMLLQVEESLDVNIDLIGGTELMEISVTDVDAARSAQAVNVLMNLLVERSNLAAESAAAPQADREALLAQLEADVASARSIYTNLLTVSPNNATAIAEAERTLDAKERTYQFVLEQTYQTQARDALQAPILSIVALASAPQAPSSPRPSIILPIALLAGLLGGLLLALLAEAFKTGQFTLPSAPTKETPTRAMQVVRPAAFSGPLDGNVQIEQTSIPHLNASMEALNQLDEMLDAPASAEPARLIQEIPTYDIGSVRHIDHRADLAEPQHASTSESMVWSAGRDVSYQVWRRSQLHDVRSLLVTSVNRGEGKTTVAIHLAARLAALGESVVLVDASVDNPHLHTLFDLSASSGLSDVLTNHGADSITPTKTMLPGLDILPIGRPSSIAHDQLRVSPLARMIQQLSNRYNFVFIDTPALDSSHLADLLAPLVDGTIVVDNILKADPTKRRFAQTRLSHAGANSIGVIENRVHIPAVAA